MKTKNIHFQTNTQPTKFVKSIKVSILFKYLKIIINYSINHPIFYAFFSFLFFMVSKEVSSIVFYTSIALKFKILVL